MTYIEWLNSTIGMPDEPSALMNEWCPKVAASEVFGEIETKYFNFEKVDDDIEKYAAENGITKELAALAFSELFSAHTLELYAKNSWPMDVYVDSLRDLAIWAKVCRRDEGMWGLRQFSWCSNQLRGTMFRLGRMQYHVITYDGPEYSVGEYSIKSGDKVLNIHIPEGDSLTREKRFASYKKAYDFFGGKYKTFTCHTYLFYEKHLEFLPENSNIRDFMSDFHLYDFLEREGDDNLWRIFDKRESYDPKTLPRDTSLRRAYAEHLERDGMMVGYGRGVFFYDGVNFVK